MSDSGKVSSYLMSLPVTSLISVRVTSDAPLIMNVPPRHDFSYDFTCLHGRLRQACASWHYADPVGILVLGQAAGQREILINDSACNSQVILVCQVLSDGLVQGLEGCRSLAEQDQSCRVPVEPVGRSR